jgi:hypothetical protein
VLVLVIVKKTELELRSAATTRGVEQQQSGFLFGRPQWRRPDAQRHECDERACRVAREVSSARCRQTSPQDSYR